MSFSVRPTTSADLAFVLATERHPDNACYITQWSEAQHAAAISSTDHLHPVMRSGQNDAHFIAQQAARSVGYCILQGLCDPHRSLLLKRIVIGPKGQGYGRQLLRWVKQYTFETLGYHRLWLDVLVSNQRAQKLYFSEGFLQEGVMREAYRTEARQYEDMLILALLEADYMPVTVPVTKGKASL